MSLAISDAMTANPHSIGKDQPLSVAERMMRQHHIRHLPVLDGGRIVGIVSERDIELAMRFSSGGRTPVEDAMVADPYIVAPNMPVRTVARAMAEHRYGCAIIAEGTRIAGVFTTVDALNAVGRLLENEADPRAGAGRRSNFMRTP